MNLEETTEPAAPLNPVEAAAAAGRRDGLKDNQVRVKGDLVLTFGELTVFDHIELEREAGQPAAQLYKANPQRYGLLVSWRSAVAGGYEVPFTEFAKQIPINQMAELTHVAMATVGKSGSPPEKPSS